MAEIIIKDLNYIEEMDMAYPLISQVYANMSFDDYKARVKEMVEENNYRMVAAYMNDKLVGVSGYWVFLMLYCGRYLQASNLVVDKDCRSLGIGKKILDCLEEKAKKFECEKIVLDSYVENKRSHPLYFREGYYIRGFHFMKDLT
jgi:GNAT superfamily N-acetyltransferase